LRDETCQWLTEWFSSRQKFSGEAATRLQVNYFEAGWLTSLEVIEFISQIEDKFGIQFSEDDFHDSRFATIAGLAELIAERSARESRPRVSS